MWVAHSNNLSPHKLPINLEITPCNPLWKQPREITQRMSAGIRTQMEVNTKRNISLPKLIWANNLWKIAVVNISWHRKSNLCQSKSSQLGVEMTTVINLMKRRKNTLLKLAQNRPSLTDQVNLINRIQSKSRRSHSQLRKSIVLPRIVATTLRGTKPQILMLLLGQICLQTRILPSP